jgi:hypothetical protein
MESSVGRLEGNSESMKLFDGISASIQRHHSINYSETEQGLIHALANNIQNDKDIDYALKSFKDQIQSERELN